MRPRLAYPASLVQRWITADPPPGSFALKGNGLLQSVYIVTRFCCSLDPPFRPPHSAGSLAPWLGADMLVVWGFWWLSADRLPQWRLFLRGSWLHYGFHSLWVWCDGSPLGSLQYSGCRDPEWKYLLTRGRCLPTEMKIEWNFMAFWKIDKIWRSWDITTTTCTDMIELIFIWGSECWTVRVESEYRICNRSDLTAETYIARSHNYNKLEFTRGKTFLP